MNPFKLFSALVVVLFLVFTTPTALLADTYQIFHLANENDIMAIIGIDSYGSATLYTGFAALGCDTSGKPNNPFPMGPCYVTYSNGVPVVASVTAPTIVDNGAGTPGPGCPAIPSFIPTSAISVDLCINGHQFFSVDSLFITDPVTGKPVGPGLYTGPDLANDRIPIGGLSLPTNVGLLIARENSFGDIVFEDIGDEEVFEVYDLTTHAIPEPGTLSLLTTGALGAAGAIRRRLRSSRPAQ